MHRVALSVLLMAAAVTAQTPSAGPSPRTFDVASVKPNNSGSTDSSSNDGRGSYRANNLPLRRLVAIAYRMQLAIDRERIVGPSWIDTARFDVAARVPPEVSNDRIPDLLRALLEDRFKLVAHTETREQPVYALVHARDDRRLGPQLKPSSLDCSQAGARGSSSTGAGSGAARQTADSFQCGIISNVDANGAVLRGGGRSLSDLAKNLTGRVNRTVIDRTELSGTYDFVLRWTPENQQQNAALNGGPSRDGTMIFTALQEQLGLKLETQRGPVEFLIIDRVEQPTPD